MTENDKGIYVIAHLSQILQYANAKHFFNLRINTLRLSRAERCKNGYLREYKLLIVEIGDVKAPGNTILAQKLVHRIRT